MNVKVLIVVLVVILLGAILITRPTVRPAPANEQSGCPAGRTWPDQYKHCT